MAEQIGAQIFIDGWAMLAPGDPEKAAHLAGRVASVSHDGEAVYGAQVLAAMEAQAFVEPDINCLLDTAVRFIPSDSRIYRLIHDLREWHAGESDWHRTRGRLDAQHGYTAYGAYGGNCHMVPNHGVVIMSLLYGDGDFQRSLMIACTSGWDTDCNAGNVGCLLGIRNTLGAFETGPDWRGPVADRLYLSTADGGRAITDAATEAYRLANMGRALAGLPPVTPKSQARFHFELPGSVHGFAADEHIDIGCSLLLENVRGHSAEGSRSLAIRYKHVASPQTARIATDTFIPPEAWRLPPWPYPLLASPTLYVGQTVHARVEADAANTGPVNCRLYFRSYGRDDELESTYGPDLLLVPGAAHEVAWQLDVQPYAPIAKVGVEISAEQRADGAVYLDYLTWNGEPNLVLVPPAWRQTMWKRAWVDAVDAFELGIRYPYRIVQNEGIGLLMQGTREWTNYCVSTYIIVEGAAAGGVAVRVQGIRRYYALLICMDGKARLVKSSDAQQVLAEAELSIEFGDQVRLTLECAGTCLRAWINGHLLFDMIDEYMPLTSGAMALVVQDGCIASGEIKVEPAA